MGFGANKLSALHVLAGAGVNADLFALVDEDRNSDLRAGFQGSWLGYVGCSVASYTRLGLGDDQLNKVWSLAAKDRAFVRKNFDNGIFLYKLEASPSLLLSIGTVS